MIIHDCPATRATAFERAKEILENELYKSRQALDEVSRTNKQRKSIIKQIKAKARELYKEEKADMLKKEEENRLLEETSNISEESPDR